jgi:hypothetical protein
MSAISQLRFEKAGGSVLQHVTEDALNAWCMVFKTSSSISMQPSLLIRRVMNRFGMSSVVVSSRAVMPFRGAVESRALSWFAIFSWAVSCIAFCTTALIRLLCRKSILHNDSIVPRRFLATGPSWLEAPIVKHRLQLQQAISELQHGGGMLHLVQF